MIFSYQVMTEEEALRERYQLLPDGEYDAYVEAAESKISKSGNPMIELTISVFDKQGHGKIVKDYLVSSSQMQWKIIHFCGSANLLEEYQKGIFNETLAQGKNVRVKIKTQEGKMIPMDKLGSKEAGDRYPDRNVIDDYLSSKKNVIKNNNINTTSQSDSQSEIDQDIPF